MKKLSLDLDNLHVDSFEVTPDAEPRRGTVEAHNFTDYYGITCAAPSICSGGYSDDCNGTGTDTSATAYPQCEQME